MTTPGLARYKFFYAGEWRSVRNMFRGQTEVFTPCQASCVVIFVGHENWVASPCTPADIVTDDRAVVDDSEAWESV